MTTFFTSDQHFGHKNVVALSQRPFSSLEEMHTSFIANHNNAVNNNDEVWHLGDFSLHEKWVREILPQLFGIHRLISGNHDQTHPKHRRAWKMYKKYREFGFEEVFERCILSHEILGKVFLSHVPLRTSGDHTTGEERYADWRPTASMLKDLHINTLLHGHVHNLFYNKKGG